VITLSDNINGFTEKTISYHDFVLFLFWLGVSSNNYLYDEHKVLSTIAKL